MNARSMRVNPARSEGWAEKTLMMDLAPYRWFEQLGRLDEQRKQLRALRGTAGRMAHPLGWCRQRLARHVPPQRGDQCILGTEVVVTRSGSHLLGGGDTLHGRRREPPFFDQPAGRRQDLCAGSLLLTLSQSGHDQYYTLLQSPGARGALPIVLGGSRATTAACTIPSSGGTATFRPPHRTARCASGPMKRDPDHVPRCPPPTLHTRRRNSTRLSSDYTPQVTVSSPRVEDYPDRATDSEMTNQSEQHSSQDDDTRWSTNRAS